MTANLTIEEFDAIVNQWDKLQEKLGIEKAREAAANAERMRLPNMMGIFSACLQFHRSPSGADRLRHNARESENLMLRMLPMLLF